MVAQFERPTVRPNSAYSNLAVEGTVQVFTCPHRSFFTGVMAQALRLAGQGTRVLVVQFLKGGIGQGADRPIQLAQTLDWIRCDLPRCIDNSQVDAVELQSLHQLWQHTQTAVLQSRYDLVVLDELSLAMNFGLIEPAQVLALLQQRPPHVDVILTGPDMPAAILSEADQVTQLRRSH
jgi:cob(I)alamin adenosyltransferase